MNICSYDLPTLFDQLGLPSDNASIDYFITSHELPTGISLVNATFWTPSQARFLKEAIEQDAEWAEVTDMVAILLTTKENL